MAPYRWLSLRNIFVVLVLGLAAGSSSSSPAAGRTCLRYLVGTGKFITDNTWSAEPRSVRGARKVELSTEGLTVTTEFGRRHFHRTLSGHVLRYLFLGPVDGVNEPLLILDSDTSAAIVSHVVTVVDFSVPREVPIFNETVASRSVPLPRAQYSQGSGSAVLVYGLKTYAPDPSPWKIGGLGIYRSDTGLGFRTPEGRSCSVPEFLTAGDILGEARATEVAISYQDAAQGRRSLACALPTSKLDVTPPVRNSVLYGYPIPAKNFKIKNVGNDCATLTNVECMAPFALVPSNPPTVPAVLEPDEELSGAFSFAPTVRNKLYQGALTIQPAQTVTPMNLFCEGFQDFHSTPAEISCPGSCTASTCCADGALGQTRSFTQEIKNLGQQPLTISKVVLGGDSAFHLKKLLTLPISLGQGDKLDVEIEFSPGLGAPVRSGSLTVTNTDPLRSPMKCEFSATATSGDQPKMVVAPAVLDFGEVELGACRMDQVIVRNDGGPCSAPLKYAVSTAGPNDPNWPQIETKEACELRAGEKHSFRVMFQPRRAGGPFETKLAVTGNDPVNPHGEILLTGSASRLRRSDLAAWADPGWKVAVASERKFADPNDPAESSGPKWIQSFGSGTNGQVLAGDFNGDGLTDLAEWNETIKGWRVALSTGRSFEKQDERFQVANFGKPKPGFMLTGDFDGDGKTDLAGWSTKVNGFHVALSTGSGFDVAPGGNGFWLPNFASPESGWTLTGDFDGNGKTDLISWIPIKPGKKHPGAWQVALSTGHSFDPTPGFRIERFGAPEPAFMLTGDFDGNGRSDIAGWNAGAQGFHVALSLGGSFDPDPNGHGIWLFNFGSPEAGHTLSGDFNGDGSTDLAWWDAKQWKVALSTGHSFERSPVGRDGGWIRDFGSASPGQVFVGNFGAPCDRRPWRNVTCQSLFLSP